MRLTTCGVTLAWVMILAAPAQTPRFAVQGHTMMGDSETHARTIEMLLEAGIGMIRDECHWSLVERTPGEFSLPENWSANLDINRANGIETLLILNYTNEAYDDGLGPHTEGGREAFARYCEFMAQETLGRVRYFEIWNEPNAAGFWPPEPNPEDYAALVAVAAEAIRAVNPEAFIIAGSTSGTDEAFFRRAFEAGMNGHCDAISIHPYCTPASPEGAEIFPRMRAIHEMSGEYGDPLPVWITEFGYPTRGASSVTEDQQANFVARTYLLALTQPWITSTFHYWFGPDQASDDWNENNFGLVRHDRTRKPSFDAVRTLTDLFASAEFSESLDVAEGIEAHVFTIPASGEYTHLTALWAHGGIRHTEILSGDDALLVFRSGEAAVLSPVPWLDPSMERLIIDLSAEPLHLITRSVPNISEAEEPLLQFDSDRWEVTRGVENLINLRWAGATDQDPRTPSLFPVPRSTDLIHIPFLHVYYPYFGGARVVPDVVPERGAPLGVYPFGAFVGAMDLEREVQVIVGHLVTELEIVPTASISLSPLNPVSGPTSAFTCTLRNHSTAAVSAEVTVTAGEDITVTPQTVSPVHLEARESVDLPFSIGGDHGADSVFRVNVRAELSQGEVVEEQDHFSFTTSPRLASPPVLDGDLTDWPEWDPIRLGSREQITGEFETWGGPEEASAQVWTGWDDECFYLAAEVKDQTLCDAVFGHEVYKNDGLEVYFDTDHDGDRDETHYSDDDNQFCLALSQGDAVAWAYSHLNDVSPGVRLVINRSPSPEQTLTGEPCGYIVEAAFPLDEINLRDPHHGMHIGFNVALNDDDDPTAVHPFGQDLQMMWTGLRLV
ncbi:cellulase family glycosylhydrolase, partial [Candidatus Sumerlaeota bacterium]|nr:cellulase family glycosylhydrolase [Candidatus Sumerlaeota bacterium]